MVYSHQLQTTHCSEAPTHTGRWFTSGIDRWSRVWACEDHLEGLTARGRSGPNAKMPPPPKAGACELCVSECK